MAKLLLVRNAAPEKSGHKPSHLWNLSGQGHADCIPLAAAIRPHEPTVVLSSDEPKAIETAELVAAELRLPHAVVPGLHEHDRSNVPNLPTREFISSMALFFAKPNQRVFGMESANQVLSRAEEALKDVVSERRGQNLAVVTHAAVIAAVVAAHARLDAYRLWRAMKAPSYVVLDAETWQLLERVDAVVGPGPAAGA